MNDPKLPQRVPVTDAWFVEQRRKNAAYDAKRARWRGLFYDADLLKRQPKLGARPRAIADNL